jgi:hypothetical protein
LIIPDGICQSSLSTIDRIDGSNKKKEPAIHFDLRCYQGRTYIMKVDYLPLEGCEHHIVTYCSQGGLSLSCQPKNMLSKVVPGCQAFALQRGTLQCQDSAPQLHLQCEHFALSNAATAWTTQDAYIPFLSSFRILCD